MKIVEPSSSRRYMLLRKHSCAKVHRTYTALAKCIWRRAHWVDGDGPYATVSGCRGTTVQLHGTVGEAERAKSAIDGSGCGGACPCTGAGHKIVQLVHPSQAVPW